MDILFEEKNQYWKEIVEFINGHNKNLPPILEIYVTSFKKLSNEDSLILLEYLKDHFKDKYSCQLNKINRTIDHLILYYKLDPAILINYYNECEQEQMIELIIEKKKESYEIFEIEYCRIIADFIDQQIKINPNLNICPISLEPIKDVLITKCGHKFEASHIYNYVHTSKNFKVKCPMCRSDISYLRE